VGESFTAIGDEFVVAELDGHLVGIGGFHRTGPDTAEIVRIRTHPACRRQAVGAALMAELERRAAEHGIAHLDLNTAHNMPEALAFYDAIGYRRTRTEANPDWSWTLQHFRKDLGVVGPANEETVQPTFPYALPAVFDADTIFVEPVTVSGERLQCYVDSAGGDCMYASVAADICAEPVMASVADEWSSASLPVTTLPSSGATCSG